MKKTMKNTPGINIRVPAELRRQVEDLAAERGISMMALARDALRRYVADPPSNIDGSRIDRRSVWQSSK